MNNTPDGQHCQHGGGALMHEVRAKTAPFKTALQFFAFKIERNLSGDNHP
jgi:hypothetical protein